VQHPAPEPGGSFGGSDGESMGSEGTSRASNISNLLIILVPIAGFDPAIRRLELFHPSQFFCRQFVLFISDQTIGLALAVDCSGARSRHADTRLAIELIKA
jgi:hypothetical protein